MMSLEKYYEMFKKLSIIISVSSIAQFSLRIPNKYGCVIFHYTHNTHTYIYIFEQIETVYPFQFRFRFDLLITQK